MHARRAILVLAGGVLVASCSLAKLGTLEATADAGDDASWDAGVDGPGDAWPAEDVLDAEDGADVSDADAQESSSTDALEDTSDAPETGPCSGVPLAGYCWYASAPEKSCSDACAGHGGCNLAGTRDFAGSGGSDANCVSVLNALGYGSFLHQDWSNNDLGCQFAWNSWTYWSSYSTTTCEAAGVGSAQVVRMCACEQ